MGDTFDSKGGDQNVGQGDHAIGRQENVTQEVRGDGCIFSGTGNVTVHGVPPEVFAQYVKELGATEQVIRGFLNTLLEREVPRDQWDKTLREIAATHKELLLRLETVQSTDPQVARLKDEAWQAIDAGDYAKAEALLEDAAKQHSISAAETYAQLASLQRVQLRHIKAAAYWQKAAALLPEESKKERANCLGNAGYDLHRIAKYSEVLPLYEQSLAIRQEIGDKEGKGTLLNNISQIYRAWGDYAAALKYLEQSLVIRREIGDKAGEGVTLNSISLIYKARGDYVAALKYLEQSLAICRKISDKAGKGRLLNNISGIYTAWGDYTTALKYLEQSLVIVQEIGDKSGEAVTSWNLGCAYEDQGDLTKAEQYISRAVQLMEEIGHPALEQCRKHLEAVRAKLRSR